MTAFFRVVRWPALALGAVVATFVGLDLLPGDAVSVAQSHTGADIAAARRHDLGLDRPLLSRFLTWVQHAVCGDFGDSFQSGVPVTALIPKPLVNSLTISVLALVLGITLGIFLGAWSGFRPGTTTDTAVTTLGITLLSVPQFVLALGLALLFGTLLGILPTVSLAPMSGWAVLAPRIIILPALTLSLITLATISRSVRGVVENEMRKPYVSAAQSNGLSTPYILFRHVLPGCSAAVAQSIVITAPAILGETVVVEQSFGYPGIGSLLVSSVSARDIPVTMAISVVLIALAAVGYASADLIRSKEGK